MRTFAQSTYPRMTCSFGYEKLRQAMVLWAWEMGGEVVVSDKVNRNNSLTDPKIIIKNLVPRNSKSDGPCTSHASFHVHHKFFDLCVFAEEVNRRRTYHLRFKVTCNSFC
jgi:hypothetical protein